MLNSFFDTLNNLSPCDVIIKIMAFLLAMSVHESSHAVVINRLSNDPMECRDRMTLNPWVHIDFIGTIVVPIIRIFAPANLPLIGWAKPVMWDSTLCSTKRFKLKTSDALTSAAGPVSNILLSIISLVTAILCIMAIAPDLDSRIALFDSVFTERLEDLVYLGAGIEIMLLKFSVALTQVNVGLAVFNLLPIGPLDGAGILCWIIPDHLYERYNVFRSYPIWSAVLIALVFCDPLYNFLTGIIATPITAMLGCITRFMLGT